jgi:hypothetical protein
MLRIIVACSLLICSTHVFSAVHWTANVKKVTVFPDGKSRIILENVSSPNPSGSTFDCTSNVVILGNPVEPSMLSVALTLYTTKNQVRIGIEGSGDNCSASYLTAI